MATAEAFTLLSIGLVIIGCRVWARWVLVGPANWQLDDYLMPLTGIVFALETVAAYLVGALFDGLTNSYMTDEQRATLDPNSREYFNRQWGSKIQVLGWSLYAFMLWLLKFCVAVFYGRLTSGLMNLKIRVRIAYVLLAVTYIFVCLSLLIGCQPMEKHWQINPDPGNLCQPTNSKLSVYAVVVPNIVTDVYLLSIPLPLLWIANISMRRKLTLMILFSGAIFVMVAGIIRAATILGAGPEGALSGSEWACRETFVSLIVTNLPIIHPFLRKAASKVGLSGLFSRSTRSKTGPSGPSHQLGSKPATIGGFGRSRNKANHPLSIPQETAWGSDEHILPQEAGRNRQLPDSSRDIVVLKEFTVTSDSKEVP
ncbi:uncharacterized protein F4822DRAFT_421975 [Hypoxylon trugodes]|uniref:uncharacterized protein n=1 Tax=Hypoxylon trugodes TaxID=326681 RepID=UPI00219F2D37|nr:uncharacterized protein F4822DRAFT_421975 [Hypoxylon trugodes]KAI1383044.1 hypothetical protein F4822DRAFT_421975 [Hypoxylon trugodes]